MSRYAVLVEKTGTGYSARFRTFRVASARAESYGETAKLIHEAIEFHIEGMILHGEQVPEPTTRAETVEVGLS